MTLFCKHISKIQWFWLWLYICWERPGSVMVMDSSKMLVAFNRTFFAWHAICILWVGGGFCLFLLCRVSDWWRLHLNTWFLDLHGNRKETVANNSLALKLSRRGSCHFVVLFIGQSKSYGLNRFHRKGKEVQSYCVFWRELRYFSHGKYLPYVEL